MKNCLHKMVLMQDCTTCSNGKNFDWKTEFPQSSVHTMIALPYSFSSGEGDFFTATGSWSRLFYFLFFSQLVRLSDQDLIGPFDIVKNDLKFFRIVTGI